MTTEAKEIAELARKAAFDPKLIVTQDGREFLTYSKDWAFENVTSQIEKVKFHTADHIRQHLQVHSTDSLIEYCGRFRTDETILIADVTSNTIAAQIDYHKPQGKSAHMAHRATLTLSYSIEWQEWNRISGKYMDQLDFARFIEENAADIRAPEAAELLECVRDLQAHRKVNFVKAVRTSSENESFEWSDETEARTKRGGIEIPTKFEIGVPVYFDEPDSPVFAFLRWALDPPALKLGVQLHRAEHVRQAVFKSIVTRIAAETGCLVVFGKL